MHARLEQMDETREGPADWRAHVALGLVMAGLIAFGQCRQDVKAAWAIAEAARARADSAAQVAKAVSPAPIGQICGTVAGERTCVLTDLATPAPILEPVEVQR